MLSDPAIIQAAERAGLCFPACWNLGALAPAAQQDDQAWIGEPGIEQPERDLRSEIVNSDRQRAEEAMNKLRCFAEAIAEQVQQGAGQ